MAGELFLSTNLDTDALNLSLADFRKSLADNAYNDIPSFRLLDQAGRKRLINGGTSIIEHVLSDKQSDGGFYTGSDTLNSVQSDAVRQIEYKWQNAYEPIQITRDLPGFWRGSWAAVKADMKGRYPRHPWPENPLEAIPTALSQVRLRAADSPPQK
jgi:HrpA-like RNA helicase